MTGIVTAFWMPSIIEGSLMRATPPSRRMSEGTRSSAITADAPASSAILACSGVTTSMMTPPRSISASPRFTRAVPVTLDMSPLYRARPPAPPLCSGRAEGARGLVGRRRALDVLPHGRRRTGAGGARQRHSVHRGDVTQTAIGFHVAWAAAPGAGSVRVYAGTDRDAVGRDRLIGSAGASGSLDATGLPASARWYFELVPKHGTSLVVADRFLHLASAPNFRDLGGYRTTDGHWVKMGALFRS